MAKKPKQPKRKTTKTGKGTRTSSAPTDPVISRVLKHLRERPGTWTVNNEDGVFVAIEPRPTETLHEVLGNAAAAAMAYLEDSPRDDLAEDAAAVVQSVSAFQSHSRLPILKGTYGGKVIRLNQSRLQPTINHEAAAYFAFKAGEANQRFYWRHSEKDSIVGARRRAGTATTKTRAAAKRSTWQTRINELCKGKKRFYDRACGIIADEDGGKKGTVKLHTVNPTPRQK